MYAYDDISFKGYFEIFIRFETKAQTEVTN